MTTPEQHHEPHDPVASQVNEAFADSGTVGAILDNLDRLYAKYPDVTKEDIATQKAMTEGAQAALAEHPAGQSAEVPEPDVSSSRIDWSRFAINPDAARDSAAPEVSRPQTRPHLGRFIQAPLFEIKPPDHPKNKES